MNAFDKTVKAVVLCIQTPLMCIIGKREKYFEGHIQKIVLA